MTIGELKVGDRLTLSAYSDNVLEIVEIEPGRDPRHRSLSLRTVGDDEPFPWLHIGGMAHHDVETLNR